MDQLNAFLNAVSKRRYQEDSIDRLNYHYTVWLLLAFALTLSAKQYVGEPIQCWVPAEFSGSWEQYTENYCFVENTYFVRFDEDVPESAEERNSREIAYYQWVPFILALEALMFYLPHVIWRVLNWQSGMYLRSIITMAADNKCVTTAGQKEATSDIAGHIFATLEMQRATRGQNSVDSVLQCGRSNNVYLTIVYLMLKILFIVNLIVQFFLLNAFLGTTYTFWGAAILRDILTDHDWQISGHFPRVTVCDFVVRKLGNNHRYTVQCVLMINMFSEKIFLFVWWWFLVVTIITIANFIYWLFVSLSQYSRRSYVQKLLYNFHRLDEEPITAKEAAKFADFAGPDVVVILRLLANNASELMASRVCKALYDKKRESDSAYAKKEIVSGEYAGRFPKRPAAIEKIGGAAVNV